VELKHKQQQQQQQLLVWQLERVMYVCFFVGVGIEECNFVDNNS
jgi:hypothetical protein